MAEPGRSVLHVRPVFRQPRNGGDAQEVEQFGEEAFLVCREVRRHTPLTLAHAHRFTLRAQGYGTDRAWRPGSLRTTLRPLPLRGRDNSRCRLYRAHGARPHWPYEGHSVTLAAGV